MISTIDRLRVKLVISQKKKEKKKKRIKLINIW